MPLARRRKVDRMIACWTTHELDEVLTATLIQSLLALVRMPAPETAHPHLANVNRGLECASWLTQRLLARVQLPPLRPVTLNLTTLCQECAVLWEAWAPPPVRLELALTPQLPAICGDRQWLQQVVLNLLVNASHAVVRASFSGQERNTIELETRLLRLDAGATFAGNDLLPAGEYACLAVCDRGPGLDEETLAELFEAAHPGLSRERGCGLRLCRQIVRAHGGGVGVEERDPAGMVFKFCLPVHTGDVREMGRHPFRQQAVALLADDDPHLRRAIADLLELA